LHKHLIIYYGNKNVLLTTWLATLFD